MKKYVNVFCSLALIMANSTAMAAAFTLFSMVEKMENTSPGLALWLPCVALCHLCLGLFLRRERSMRALIYFCAVFYVLQAVLTFLVYGFFSSFVGVLAAMAMWLYSYYNCLDFNVRHLTAERLTKGFDLCSFALILMLFYCSVRDISMKIVLPLAVSDVLCLFALIAIRGGEQRKMRSLAMSGGIVLIFGAVAAAFVALASGGLKKLVELTVFAAKAVVLFFLRSIDAVFRFLLSLFPEKEYELEALPVDIPTAAGEMGDMSFQLVDPQIIIAAMIGLGLFIALVLIVYRIIRGKKNVIKISGGSDKGLRRERRGLYAVISRALSRLFAKLRFAYKSVVLRNTAPGLFLQIEKRSRPKLKGRKSSESCREFLQRAAEIYPHAASELEKLSDTLDAIYFGAGVDISSAEIVRMRKQIFKNTDEKN